MKKIISLLSAAALTAGIMCPYAYADGAECYLRYDNGSTVMHGGVSLGKQDYPLDITVSVYDGNGTLNFQYVITTDLDGKADFAYINDGASGDYTCYFAEKGTGLEKSAVCTGFKGKDYFDDICARINALAAGGDFAAAAELIYAESTSLGFNTAALDRVADRQAAAELMKNEYGGSYASAQDAVKSLKRSAAVAYINAEHSAAAVNTIYNEDKMEKYLGIAENIPMGTNAPIIEEISETARNGIIADIAKTTLDTRTAAAVFAEKTLFSGIKNAATYDDVVQLLKAYKNAGKLNINIDVSVQKLAQISKNMRGGEYTTYQAVESAYAQFASAPDNNGSSGGGSSSGGGFSVKNPQTTPGSTDNSGNNLPQDDTAQSAPMYFNDIEDSKWALKAINYLYEKKVISGNGDGTFMPTNLVTRAEFAKMAVTFRGYELADTAPFTDVKNGDWFLPYVGTAYERGIFSGYEDGSFGVTRGITRAEAAAVIYRLICEEGSIKHVKMPETPFADDAAIPDWAKTAVYSLYDGKVISGRGENVFSPAEQLTRAEAAVLIYNARTYFE